MIYTFTFNPALDVSGTVKKLVPNEKCYVFAEKHSAGGNGINSGLVSYRLGADVLLSGFLGGSNGHKIEYLLQKENIPQRFIPIRGDTRMNVTISNENDHHQTRLSFPGPQISIHEKKSLDSVIKDINVHDIVILGGSLPSGIDTSFIRSLVRRLSQKKIRVIVDMPGDILREVLLAGPFFIKPNLTEFEALVGKRMKSITSVVEYAQGILPFTPYICVSSVAGGALLISENEVWFGRLPAIKIYSTVGAGDSMVGAMAFLWAKNKDVALDDLLRMGLAASCATLTEKGTSLGKKKDILRYRNSMIIKQIDQ
jgi:1-phosphofructokinase family hexose kinase